MLGATGSWRFSAIGDLGCPGHALARSSAILQVHFANTAEAPGRQEQNRRAVIRS
jgi:hypothetical protein